MSTLTFEDTEPESVLAERGGHRTVVVLPGGAFGPYAPALFFPMWAAHRRGATIRAHEWEDAERAGPMAPGLSGAQVELQVAPLLDGCDPSSWLVVGKSLASFAAASVADCGLPAVWVTPLLRESWVADGLRRARAPFLLVGGTGDRTWDSELARALTPHVREIPGADHGLFVPGPLAESAATMGLLAAAVEAFLDEVVWPG